MLDILGIEGIGSEGVVVITLFLVIKELVIPMWQRLLRKRAKPDETVRRLDPDRLTLAKLHQAVKDHESYDNERTLEIKSVIREIEKELRKHGERIAVLGSRDRNSRSTTSLDSRSLKGSLPF
ncbi:MAG: hypothetical protein JSV46_04575 [Candidatus Aminicenantes bacterium]|nr:MAG: hypothetical protein JSV46_04575 [Candidatus Aminicenantes bacterium]